MEYKIIGKYNETYLEECLSLWTYSSKAAFNSVKSYSICCLAYIAFVLLDYLRGKSISLFLSSFGIACFLLLITQLLSNYQLKSKTKKYVLARIEKYKSNVTLVRELIFSENCIQYCDPEMLLELKWTAISHYQEYGNYIFFFLDENKKPALSMDKNNIPKSIEKDLFVFINSKISTRA